MFSAEKRNRRFMYLYSLTFFKTNPASSSLLNAWYKVMVKAGIYMQLSITTDYAIRITLYLLKHKEIVRSSELSEKLEIPKTYVLKVTKKLEKVGLVKSYQGASGGIVILKDADQITLWDVIDATENTTMINKCLEKMELVPFFKLLLVL